MKSVSPIKPLPLAIALIGAYINSVAMQYLWSISGDMGTYMGMQIYSFMPESLLWFVICAFLFYRFIVNGSFRQTGKVLLSVFFGFFLGFYAIYVQELSFNTTLFDSASRTVRAPLATLGLMIFTVPFVSEVTGLFDGLSERFGALSMSAGASDKGMRPWLYGLLIWLLTFASFVPMLLFSYPINLNADASDALGYDYLGGRRSTHHTPIHWLLMGWSYDWGLKHGDPSKGMLIFTLAQMLILSGAIAFLSYYLYKKKTAPALRRTVILLSILNPVNSNFAISAEKGTIGIALALAGSVLLIEILDDLKDPKGRMIPRISISVSAVVKMLLFAVIVSLGCLFRNNMIYAVVAGGLVIALLTKGIAKKAMLIVMVLLTFLLYKGEFGGIEKWQDLKTTDQYRESLSLPIMCLSRIAVLHVEDMDPDMYGEIVEYIPESALEGYSVSIADSVKGAANEALLKNETKRFLKLFVKGFFKYPGDYLDQFGWLTAAYFNPMYAHVLGGTGAVFYGGLRDDAYTDIDVRNLIPGGGKFLTWMYRQDGRFKTPVLSWFFRPAIYVWLCIYAFFYGIYRKNPRKVSLSVIPLMYFGTLLLGPLVLFRYLYLNILFLGYTVYVILESKTE